MSIDVNLIFGILYAFITTCILIFVLKSIQIISKKSYSKIKSWRETKIKPLKVQNLVILSPNQIVVFLRYLIKLVRILITLFFINLYISFVFSFFPQTHGLSAKLFHYLFSPFVQIGEAGLNYLPNLFFLIAIIIVTFYALRFTKFIFTEIEKGVITFPQFYPEWAIPTYKIIRLLIIAFAAAVSFPYIPGSDSPAFKGISILFGVLFSFGSGSAISNIIAGLILTYMRAFKIGDRVRIGDAEGDIVEKTLLITRIRTIKNVDITIPNSKTMNEAVINFSSSSGNHGLILHTSVTIGYDAPWRKIHELLISAAKHTENILTDPKPFVFQTALNDFYVTYEINAYTDKPNQMAKTYSDLHQNIQDRFNEAGVEIMSPHYTQIRDGNKTAIPKEYLPKDYIPSGIRIKNL